MNAFDLYATISLVTDAYEAGLKKAEEDGKNAADNIASSGSSGLAKFGSIMGTVGKATAAGFVAAGTGVAALTKQSVDAYGQYQQLVGGIETLYGDAADQIMYYADNAYTSAGLSANAYMETTITGSAAMIKALEEADAKAQDSNFIPDPSKIQQGIEETGSVQQRAAELVNLSITDMADNVNKMGTNMESVQNAYKGFSRANYTMLDNLSLGYAGTKEGMEELLADAEALSGVHYEVGNYADMVQAIHVIQENMGISGTTAAEAAGTLTGSMASFTAAWQNLVTGLANGDADLSVLIDNVITQAKGALNNIMPIVTQALTGIGQLIQQAAPIIAEELPPLIEAVLPSLLSAAGDLVIGVVNALPSLMGILSTTLPTLLKTAIPSLLQALPNLVQAAIQLVSALASGIGEALPVLVPALITCILEIVRVLTEPNNVIMLTEAGMELIEGLIVGIGLAIPDLVAMAPEIIENLIVSFGAAWGAFSASVAELIHTLFASIKNKTLEMFGMSEEQFEEGWIKIGEKFSAGVEAVKTFFSDGATAILEGATTFFTDLGTDFTDGLTSVGDTVSSKLDDLGTLFSDIWETIKTTVSNGIDALLGLFDFEWSLPDLKIPHFSVTGGEAPYGIGGKGSLPSIDIEWYKKAYDDAYILNSPTIFGLAGGKLMGGGEGTGSEAIVGTDLLVDMMRQAVAENGAPQIDVQIFIGGEEVDGFVVQSNQRNALISGGRA